MLESPLQTWVRRQGLHSLHSLLMPCTYSLRICNIY